MVASEGTKLKFADVVAHVQNLWDWVTQAAAGK